MEYVSRTLAAVQYTGANGAEVLTLCQGITQLSGNTWSTTSDDGTTLLLKEVGTTGLTAAWPVTSGQWVVIDMSVGIIARLSDATYKARYRNPAQVAQPALYGGMGVATVPTLIAGGSAQVAVTVVPQQPDMNYVASSFLTAAVSVLAGLSITGTAKTSASVVTVTVQNTGLLSLSGAATIVHVTAPTSVTPPGKQ